MSDCLFCKIVAGEIPSKKVYEDELCYAFKDIAPQAPTHFLVVPKAHIQSVSAVTEESAPVVGHIFAVLPSWPRKWALPVPVIAWYPTSARRASRPCPICISMCWQAVI